MYAAGMRVAQGLCPTLACGRRLAAVPVPPQRQQLVATAASLRTALQPAVLTLRRFQHLQPHRRLPTAVAAAAAAASGAEAAPAAAVAAPQSGAASRAAAVRLAVDTLKPDWPLLAVTCAALAATITFTLLFPLAIGEVFDVVRAQGGLAGAADTAVINPFNNFGAIGAAPTSFRGAMIKLASLLVLSATGNALVSYFSTLLGERFAHRLRGRLMQTIMSQDQAFFDATTKGDLVSRLTLDVTVLQTTLADFIGQRGFRSMFEVLGALCFIAFQQPLLALVSFAITPALSRLLRAVVVRSSAIIYRRQLVAAQALDYAAERLAQVQTVQVFAQEGREASAFTELSQQGNAMAQRYAVFQGIVEGAGRLAVNVGTVALLGFGGLLVIQDKISVGALLAVNVFNLFISVGLSAVAASLGELGKAVGALERVANLVTPDSSSSSGPSCGSAAPADANMPAPAASSSRSSTSEPAAPGAGLAGWASTTTNSKSSSSNGASASTSASTSSSPADTGGEGGTTDTASSSGRVEFRDVWFKYLGAQDWAVRGLNLTLQPGQTMALVGPSGGGKSTIAALLLGLYHPQRGTILVNGQPLRPMAGGGSGATASGMAAVLQQPMLMSGSVREQISYGKPDATFEEVLAAAKAAHADEFVQQLPQGYDTEVGERGHALSGGQKQRLAIARALLLHPKILVLDEVTSALDVTSEKYISDTLRKLNATKLIIAHRLSTVRRADVIAVVEGGHVAEQGSHEELLQVKGGTYQRLISTAELGGSNWVQSGASDSSTDSSGDEEFVGAGGAPAAGTQPPTPAVAGASG